MSFVFENRATGNTKIGQSPLFNICIWGDRSSGKTTLVRDILYKLDLPSYILNGVETDNYLDVPNVLYSETYTNTGQISLIFEKMSKGDRRNPKVLVLEDLPESIYKSRDFINIFKNGWAYKIIVIATMSSAYYLSPQIRELIDCVFILRTSPHVKETIYQNYFGYFKDFLSCDLAFPQDLSISALLSIILVYYQ